ncbi:MAG: BadF/BadG/BcrA/BcrD ATPase family protein [Phaeovulum sp.]|uniref:BadF/BadG/BcrA/BcrD ATPase family protein n=1 Tax=Phaeovulum sp. TaxID=2934796 RepID=UPI0027375B9A|nr:BadF/BadG/BcrA/BcrD ATPase family protein [Phaeovulum sp.]MDP3862125.1 BadF/BadG/BcrA/BcrD ATPase family protein [Phaeovulum sp.]
MFYLGIDGGGSGCRAVLADASGRVLGRGIAGPANVCTDAEAALANVLVASAQAMAGVCVPAEVVAVLGLAGANVAAGVLAARLPFARVRIESDVLTSVKGAFHDDAGIVAVLGTGSVFARQMGGEIRSAGGWGLILGDEGGGAWLGRALLARALRAVDGHTPQTPLLAGIVTEFGSSAGVVQFAAQATPAEFAALAPRLVESDDAAAQALMREADTEVAAAIELLQPPAGRLPVAFLGGLGPIFAARLGGRWPRAESLGDALAGALWLARADQANKAPVRVAR